MRKEHQSIHPDLQRIAQLAPRITYSHKNLWFLNWLMQVRPAPRPPLDILIKNIFIPGRDGQIRLRIYRPVSFTAPAPVLVWLHGGGYVMGNPEQDDGGCIQYARQLGILVVSVDYRYAPKYPFPAGLEDCYSTLMWLVSQAQQMGVDEKRIVIGGASAGGGLAAALVQLAHDRQEVAPVFQLLVYPMLDDRTVFRSDIDDSNNITWNHKSNRFGWESYLGMNCGTENIPPYAVPARRKDLSDLPPAWIGVGTLDLFCEEDTAYAQRLNESGVSCELYTIAGAFHGFDVIASDVPIVQQFRSSQIDALRKCLFP